MGGECGARPGTAGTGLLTPSAPFCCASFLRTSLHRHLYRFDEEVVHAVLRARSAVSRAPHLDCREGLLVEVVREAERNPLHITMMP